MSTVKKFGADLGRIAYKASVEDVLKPATSGIQRGIVRSTPLYLIRSLRKDSLGREYFDGHQRFNERMYTFMGGVMGYAVDISALALIDEFAQRLGQYIFK